MSLLTASWGLGLIIGPAIGGRPVARVDCSMLWLWIEAKGLDYLSQPEAHKNHRFHSTSEVGPRRGTSTSLNYMY